MDLKTRDKGGRMIWERYLFKELSKIFLLLIAAFYFFYVLVDYSLHTKNFHQESLSLGPLILYYLCQFSKQASLFIPVALMLAGIKVLTTMNIRGEIVALVSAGISRKRLVRPLLLFASSCSLFLYLNIQFIQPHLLEPLHLFEEQHIKGHLTENRPVVHSVTLQDNSLLLYQKFDPKEEAFLDVFWIDSFDKIFRIKKLFPFEKVPFGLAVDVLVRIPSGEIDRKESLETLAFPQIRFDPKDLFSAIHPPEWQSLSKLLSGMHWKQTGFYKGGMSDREAIAASYFFHKLTAPLICLLVVLAPLSFCIRFGRHLHVFFIYAFSLFGVVAFFTLINACLILGESQVIPPFWAILVPPFFAFVVCGWKYAKL